MVLLAWSTGEEGNAVESEKDLIRRVVSEKGHENCQRRNTSPVKKALDCWSCLG